MKYKIMKQVVSMIVLLLCFGYYTSKDAIAFETPFFSIKLPKGFVLLSSSKNQNRENDNFTYAFIEGNKERKKSILLVIDGEGINDKNRESRDSGLLTATNALRDHTYNDSECKGLMSDISSEIIGNTKSLFFIKTNQECNVVVERYWAIITDKYFMTFYLAMPENADQRLFEEAGKSIKDIILKK
jgi:hypothetical protein